MAELAAQQAILSSSSHVLITPSAPRSRMFEREAPNALDITTWREEQTTHIPIATFNLKDIDPDDFAKALEEGASAFAAIPGFDLKGLPG